MEKTFSHKQKRWITGICSSLGVTLLSVIFALFISPDFFNGLENASYDYRHVFWFQLEKEKKSEEKTPLESIVIVDIDERSLAKLGPYNQWPRSYHGKVVRELNQGGATAILFDIMFKTADFGQNQTESLLELLSKLYPKQNWPDDRSMIKNELNYDSQLIANIRDTKGVIAAAFLNRSDAYPNFSDFQKLTTREWHQNLSPHSTAKWSQTGLPPLRTLPILDNIFPELAQNVQRIGLVNVVPDLDGVHRSLPLLYNFPDTQLVGPGPVYSYPVLALQGALMILGKNLSDAHYSNGYLNLGSPLTLTKTKNKLNPSLTSLTGPMLEELKKKVPEILALKLSPGKSIRVTPPLVLKKTLEGDLIESIDGQVVSTDIIKPYINSTLKWSEFLRQHPSEEKDLALLTSPDGEEFILDRFTYKNLIQFWPQEEWDQLPKGKNLHLSHLLEFKARLPQGDLTSSINGITEDILMDLQKLSDKSIEDLREGQKLFLGKNIQIPLDAEGRMLLRYAGKGGTNQTFRYLSYYDVLAGRIEPTLYQGKTFILGSSAPALFDIVASPFQETYPGLEIHTTALHNILNQTFMTKTSQGTTLTILVTLSLMTGLLAYFLPLWLGIPLAILISTAQLGFCLYLFSEGWWIEITRPQIGILLALIGGVITRYIFEEREKKFLHSAFKNYISPELIDSMVDSGKKPELGGQEHVLTAYFTDIQGFSTFSEKLGSPTKLVELLNEYLSKMTTVLLKERGTLDKYEGDAIIAFFGAPVPLTDHARAACLTAIRMQDELQNLRVYWRSLGDRWPLIVHNMRMRIGINSGPIVTGNMGSSVRMNYTMMGDAVNLAARLESVAKQYGVYTLVSEETLKLAGPGFVTRELDRIRVVGKSEPVTIHELVCLSTQLVQYPSLQDCLKVFARALTLYREQKWQEAQTLFEEAELLEPRPPLQFPECPINPSKIFIDRCYKFMHDRRVHVAPDWDGVFTATEK